MEVAFPLNALIRGDKSSQKSRAGRPEGLRAAGTARTMTHNTSIASPMNSKTSASTVNLPKQTGRLVGEQLISD